jgi:hypothetical protein
MERLMTSPAQDLPGTLSRLKRHLARLMQTDVMQASFGAELAALATDLQQAGEWLRDVNSSAYPAEEFTAYRRMLLDLQGLIIALQNRVLIERTRLQTQRAHLRCAADWARASRKTSL